MSDPTLNVGSGGGFINDRPIDLANYQTGAWDTAQWGATTKMLARDVSIGASEQGIADPYTGKMLVPPEAPVDKDTLNEKYGIDGVLHFDQSMPDSAARQMYAAAREDQARQDAVARRPHDLLSSVEDFGVGAITSALDPVNVASYAMVPELGASRFVAGLAGHVLEGAAEGALSQLPLSAMQAADARMRGQTYTLGDIMADVGYGALLGGVAHGAGEYFKMLRGGSEAGEAIDKAPLENREGALRTSLAQLADGRPVEVAPYFDSSGGMFDKATRLGEAQRLAADPYADAPTLAEAKPSTTPELDRLAADNAAIEQHIQRIAPGTDLSDTKAVLEDGESLSRAYEQAASCIALAG
jgi:hypothetical protein